MAYIFDSFNFSEFQESVTLSEKEKKISCSIRFLSTFLPKASSTYVKHKANIIIQKIYKFCLYILNKESKILYEHFTKTFDPISSE